MTETLKALLEAKTRTAPALNLDIDRMLVAGQRRIARRRVGWAAAAVGVAASALLATQLLLPGTPGKRTLPEASFAAAFAALEPTYSLGNVVHISDRTFTVEHDLVSFTQTTVGIVYADKQQRVWASDGATETQVGTIDVSYGRIVSDGSMAAWLEGGEPKHYVVYNQETGQAQRTEAQVESRKGRGEFADVAAIDGPDVHAVDDRGLVAWNTTTGAVTVTPQPSGQVIELSDAKAGILAWSAHSPTGDDMAYRVGATLADGRRIRSDSGYVGHGRLSPDAAILAAEVEDGMPALFDTATGERLPLDQGNHGFLALYRWTGADSIAGIGIDTSPASSGEAAWTFDLLTCRVSTGSCQVTAPAVAGMDDPFNLPVGEAMDS